MDRRGRVPFELSVALVCFSEDRQEAFKDKAFSLWKR